MKRWSAALLPVLALALVSGCGAPSGTDGNLLDDWPAMAAAGVPVPKVGTCWNGTGTANSILASALTEVKDCSADHVSETFHVGTLTGAAAEKSSPPEGADLSQPYSECDKAARDYLGEDWHNGLLVMRVFVPTARQWDAEARFFRCDFIEIGNDTGKMNSRKASVKDGLKGDKPLQYKCMQVMRDANKLITDFVPTDCAQPHNGEYAGTFFASDRPYPSDATVRRNLIQPGCKTIVAQFLGMTEGQYDQHKQISFAWSTAAERRWEYGDRSARCFVMLLDTLTTTKSLRNHGTGPVS